MKISRYYPVDVIATGLLVLIVFCLSLFWCRVLAHRMIRPPQAVRVSPSGLVSDDIEHDPNTVAKSRIVGGQQRVPAQVFLGRHDDIDCWLSDSLKPDRLRPRPRSTQVSSAPDQDDWKKRSWQPKTGQLVETLFAEKKTSGRYTQWDQRITAHVGPQGFSEQGTEAIGRFYDPLVIQAGGDKDAVLLYDQKQRCFFRIDFADQQIRQGPEVPTGVSVLQFGDIGKNEELLDTSWYPPQRMETEQEREERQKESRARKDSAMETYGTPGDPNDPNMPGGAVILPGMMMDPRYMEMMGMGPGWAYGWSSRGMDGRQYMDTEDEEALQRIAIVQGVLSSPRATVLVLSTSGHIYELNVETLALSQPLGRFPELKYSKLNKPGSALAHQVKLFYLDGEYAGCVVTTLSRDWTELGVSVFDKSGWVSGFSERSQWQGNTDGLAALTIKSAAEVLHPMGFSLLSLVWGVDCEAIRSHRALFIQSDSFAVNTLRNTDRNLVHRVSAIVFWFSMPLALGIFLAWLMARDVRRLGLPDACRTAWTLAALALGPVAYVTYRITRPDLSLVTCSNCGRLRRVDQEQCHLCNAAWDVPELTAPAWRVV